MLNSISKGNAEALYIEYSQYVYRVALFLTKSKSLAEDITHEVFLRIFEKYGSYDSSKQLKPWIYKITINTTRNTLRKQKWLSFFYDVPEAGDSHLVEYKVLRDEELSEIWENVGKLSQKTKEVLILHYFAELRLTDVSEILDIPLGTCKSRLDSALKALRKQLPRNMYYILDGGGSGYEI